MQLVCMGYPEPIINLSGQGLLSLYKNWGSHAPGEEVVGDGILIQRSIKNVTLGVQACRPAGVMLSALDSTRS